MPLQGYLSVERMCCLAQVNRAGFYRYLRDGWSAEEDMALRAAVQGVVIEHRLRYGYRRVTAELRVRGMLANHKRVARIMSEDNLLAVERNWRRPPDHSIRAAQIYLNLPRRLALSGPDQLWAADITYIRLIHEFVYLAVVLDLFSRKVIGWALGRGLTTQLPLSALDRAIANRKPPPGVVHHSDQGVQYASRAYMERLHEHHMLPSMSRPANPYDNATCESFLKTLKQEEIHTTDYRDFDELHDRVEEFIEQYYNRLRLHSALSYLPPDRFEDAAQSESQPPSTAAMMTFWGR